MVVVAAALASFLGAFIGTVAAVLTLTSPAKPCRCKEEE
jgi:hypothetical protein